MGRYTGKKCRLMTMFVLTLTFFAVELVVGYFTNSMALVADSFHMLSDVMALFIAFLSVRMSPRKWSKNTFGYARAEVLGALVNSVFLLALCFSIFVEALKRLYEPEELTDPMLILSVGIVGLIINVIGLCLFHKHGHTHDHSGNGKHMSISVMVATDDNENDKRFTSPQNAMIVPRSSSHQKNETASQMNMRGVFLHVLSDALGSIIVITSALIVEYTNWTWEAYVDPALSLCLVALITYSTLPLLKETAFILLQTVPTHIQVDEIQKMLLGVDGVLAVHEFHVWSLAGNRIIASAHIRCRNLKDYMMLAEQVKKLFHEEGIHSTTIQPEFVEVDDDFTSQSIHSNEDCILDCPINDKGACAANTCCGKPKQVKNANKQDSTGKNSKNSITKQKNHKQQTGSESAVLPDIAIVKADASPSVSGSSGALSSRHKLCPCVMCVYSHSEYPYMPTAPDDTAINNNVPEQNGMVKSGSLYSNASSFIVTSDNTTTCDTGVIEPCSSSCGNVSKF